MENQTGKIEPCAFCGSQPYPDEENNRANHICSALGNSYVESTLSAWNRDNLAFAEFITKRERAAWDAARSCQIEYVENIPCGYGPYCYDCFEEWEDISQQKKD